MTDYWRADENDDAVSPSIKTKKIDSPKVYEMSKQSFSDAFLTDILLTTATLKSRNPANAMNDVLQPKSS